VVADEGVYLFDASPDIRTQYAAVLPLLGNRDPHRPFDAVCITHLHMGHYVGLVHFGKEAASTSEMPLIAPSPILDFLQTHQPWRSLFENHNLLARPIDDGPISFGAITIRSIPIPHRAEFAPAVAYSLLVEREPWALYLPDIDSWDEWPEAEDVIGAHVVSLVDATFGSPDELPGRDLTAIPHPLVTDTIERFSALARRHTIILTHMNHSNTVADSTSPLAARAHDAGFVIASDGMQIDEEGAIL
jgi:pyrroloquinoline quinone biosynthesis protein B